MAYTKSQLEAIKNTLLASNQPILANQHREQIQSMIDEMYDAQSRADILVGVQADTITGGSDTFIVFRSGEAYQIPLSLLSANTLANLGDVFISNLADGETLVYNAVAERWENQNIFLGFALSNLEDVQLTSLANGDILRYNSSSDKWENTSLATILSPYALLTDLNAYQLLSQKGQANGYAQLDSGAKLPISIIPDSVLGQVEYQGTWNASTNTPTLPATPLKKGDYYVVSADGTQFGIDFLIGDWIISNGTVWEKVDNTDAVTSVFGRLGNIVANASDYSAFYVTLDTTQTITGAKTFTLDTKFNGVNVGRGAGNINTNTAVGNSALSFNSTGGLNTAVGNSALGFNTTGGFNTAVGQNTLISNSTGSFNTATGQNALVNNTSGSFNTAVGNSDLLFNTTGSNNVALGFEAGTRIASGGNNTITNNSIYIGSDTRANADNETNQIVIGHNAIGQGSNTVTIGNSSIILNRFFGTMRIGTINNGVGDFITTDANGVLTKRTAAQTLSDIGAAPSVAGGYLPLSGGTLTGALNGTSAVFSGDIAIGGESNIYGGLVGIYALQNGNSSYYSFDQELGIVGNAYFNNGWKYKTSNLASRYTANIGSHSFQYAISGNANDALTWISALTIASTGAATFSSSVTAASASIGYTSAAPTNGMIVQGNVGIGTTAPSAKLDVSGDILVNGLTVGRGSGNIDSNTAIGNGAGNSNTSGISNTFFGRDSGFFNTSGSRNCLFGQNAGAFQTIGNNNLFFGFDSGRNIANGSNLTESYDSIFIGLGTRANNNGQVNQIVIGHNAVGIGSDTVVLGNTSIATTVLRGNVGIGTTAPSQKLDVVGNSAAVRVAEVGGAEIRTVAGGSTGFFGTYSNHDMTFLTNGSERLRITSAGRIQIALAGIPTSDPNIAGQLYRNVVGQLFISLGVV